jgi:hypothetical protein
VPRWIIRSLENVLLTLAKMGRLSEAAKPLEEYHDHFGRLPNYELTAVRTPNDHST